MMPPVLQLGRLRIHAQLMPWLSLHRLRYRLSFVVDRFIGLVHCRVSPEVLVL
jgi:hypothetical protein